MQCRRENCFSSCLRGGKKHLQIVIKKEPLPPLPKYRPPEDFKRLRQATTRDLEEVYGGDRDTQLTATQIEEEPTEALEAAEIAYAETDAGDGAGEEGDAYLEEGCEEEELEVDDPIEETPNDHEPNEAETSKGRAKKKAQAKAEAKAKPMSAKAKAKAKAEAKAKPKALAKAKAKAEAKAKAKAKAKAEAKAKAKAKATAAKETATKTRKRPAGKSDANTAGADASEGTPRSTPRPGTKQIRIDNCRAVVKTPRTPAGGAAKAKAEPAPPASEHDLPDPAEVVGALNRANTQDIVVAETSAQKELRRKQYKARKERFYRSMKSGALRHISLNHSTLGENTPLEVRNLYSEGGAALYKLIYVSSIDR